MPGRVSLALSCLIAFCFLISGCAATGKPTIWKDKEASFTDYRQLDVRAVSNETGKTFEEDVAALLTTQLKEKFVEKNLPLLEAAQPGDDTLIVQSAMLVFVAGDAFKRWLMPGAGKTQCTVRTRLVDARTDRMVAEIVTAKEVAAGGLYSVGADEWILKDVAEDIAQAVADILHPTEAK